MQHGEQGTRHNAAGTNYFTDIALWHYFALLESRACGTTPMLEASKPIMQASAFLHIFTTYFCYMSEGSCLIWRKRQREGEGGQREETEIRTETQGHAVDCYSADTFVPVNQESWRPCRPVQPLKSPIWIGFDWIT